MCGIVGYVGAKPVVSVIINGLKKLEYRGYDSAGVAVVRNRQVQIRRVSGKLTNLIRSLDSEPLTGEYGIGHTRWATHGRPTEENAHPHRDCTGKVVVVHNGIVENYLDLKTRLQKSGHRFVTETDTEVIAHLVESELPGKSFPDAAGAALEQLRGSFAVCMLSGDYPNTIIAARNGPPLILGISDGELFVASDVPALLEHTRTMYFMKDGEMAVLSPEGISLRDFRGKEISFTPQEVQWSPEMAEKGGFRHFMLKEIYEQPRSLQEAVAGRISLDTEDVILEEAKIPEEALAKIERIHIVACGTSWHAALVGKFLIEDLARFLSKSTTGPNSAIAIRWWIEILSSLRSANREKRLTPWRLCGKPRQRTPEFSQSATLLEACSPEKAKGISISAADPRSVSLRQKHLPARLPYSKCWRSI